MFRLLLILLLAIAPNLQAVAQGSNTTQEIYQREPVIIDGHTLFLLRGASAFPASKRAKLVAERIIEVARNDQLIVDTIVSEKQGDHIAITAGDTVIVRLFDADAEAEGLHLEELSMVNLLAIKKIVSLWRTQRSLPALLRSVGLALLATTLLGALILLLRFSARRLQSLVEKHSKAVLDGVKVQRVRLIDPEQIRQAQRSLITALNVLLTLIFVFLWLQTVLGLFPWTRSLSVELLHLLVGPIMEGSRRLLQELPNLLVVLVVVLVTRYLLQLIQVFFRAVDRHRIRMEHFEAEWAWPTYRIVRVAVIAFALVMAYPYIPGSQSDAFKGVTLFIGLILSLGSSSAISNIIAGYTMTYRKAFKLGDRIRFGEIEGTVEEVRLLVTHIRSLKNEEVVVPNSLILNSSIVNFSTLAMESGLVLHTSVGIGYEVPWRQVEAMLLQAAGRTDGLDPELPPFVLVKSLGDYAINYELNVYCRSSKHINQIYTELHHNILDIFNEYEVQIMTPSYETDTPEPKLVKPENWHLPPAEKLARKQGQAEQVPDQKEKG